MHLPVGSKRLRQSKSFFGIKVGQFVFHVRLATSFISFVAGKLTVLAHRLSVLEALGGCASCPIKGEDAVDAVLEVVNGLASSLQVKKESDCLKNPFFIRPQIVPVLQILLQLLDELWPMFTFGSRL